MTQSTGSQRRSVNPVDSASNVAILGGSFTTAHQKYASEGSSSLEPIYEHVAPNAILNAHRRADLVGCDPGTRVGVIRTIEKWIAGDGDPSRSIFWLRGGAGTGKTAIACTIADRCAQRGGRMAGFSFSRSDTTCNHAGSVVATLLHQILQLYPTMETYIAILLKAKPLIFDQSIRDQFKYLIDIPVRTIVDTSAQTQRLLLLIDGLDECGGQAKHVQGDLLHSLHHLVSQQDSPFIVLVASRAALHLQMSFDDIGSSNDSISLDDTCHPSQDIRLYAIAEFEKIKRDHPLAHTLGDQWPSESDIDEIVDNSAGQFIYVSTVMRFISDSFDSPAHSLDRVRESTRESGVTQNVSGGH